MPDSDSIPPLPIDLRMEALALDEQQQPWFIEGVSLFFSRPTFFADVAAAMNEEMSAEETEKQFDYWWKLKAIAERKVYRSRRCTARERLIGAVNALPTEIPDDQPSVLALAKRVIILAVLMSWQDDLPDLGELGMLPWAGKHYEEEDEGRRAVMFNYVLNGYGDVEKHLKPAEDFPMGRFVWHLWKACDALSHVFAQMDEMEVAKWPDVIPPLPAGSTPSLSPGLASMVQRARTASPSPPIAPAKAPAKNLPGVEPALLDERDLNILKALRSSAHALAIVDIDAKCSSKVCGRRVKLLIEKGFVARKSPRGGVAIAAAGTNYLKQHGV